MELISGRYKARVTGMSCLAKNRAFLGPYSLVETEGDPLPRIRRVTELITGHYRGNSLIRNRTRPGPYSRPMPRALWWS